jgi:hypothetical protein
VDRWDASWSASLRHTTPREGWRTVSSHVVRLWGDAIASHVIGVGREAVSSRVVGLGKGSFPPSVVDVSVVGHAVLAVGLVVLGRWKGWRGHRCHIPGMPEHRIGLEEGIPFRTRVARSRHKLSEVQGIQAGKVIALGDCRKLQLHFEGLAAPVA